MFGRFGVGFSWITGSHLIKPVLVSVVTLAMVGCSNSTDPDADNGTGLSIEQFLGNDINDSAAPLSDEERSAVSTSLNRASFSFVQQALAGFEYDPFSFYSDDPNNAIITWPLLGSLPLPMLASAGTTAEQIEAGLSDFGAPISLLGFRQLLTGAEDSHAGESFENHAWWQSGSTYNDDFLNLFNATSTPEHHIQNFHVNNSDALVYSLVESVCGSDCYAYFDDTDETRLLSASILNHGSTFSNEGVTVQAFSGNFQYGNMIAKNVPLLRLQGNLEQHQSEILQASRVTLPHAGLRLISIEPTPDHFQDVLENIEHHIAELNGLWTSSSGSLVLPTFNAFTYLPEETLHGWSGLEEAYSEVHADLRNLDSRGGLYLQSGGLESRVTLNQEGISLHASHVQTVTFSEVNQPDAGFIGGHFDSINLISIPNCGPETLPDLRERIFVIEDIDSGLVMAVIKFMRMGSSESCYIQPFEIEAE